MIAKLKDPFFCIHDEMPIPGAGGIKVLPLFPLGKGGFFSPSPADEQI